MRNIVDRMSRMSKKIEIQAEQTGRVVFRVEHGASAITTYYNGLQPRYEALDPMTDAGNTADVTVDIKKLSQILNLSNLSHSQAILCK